MSARDQEPKAAAAPPQDQQYDLAKAKDGMAKAKELLLQVQDPQHEHHAWANLELIPLDEPCSPLYKPPGDARPADPAEELREVWLWLTSSMDGVDVEDMLPAGQPQQVWHALCLVIINMPWSSQLQSVATIRVSDHNADPCPNPHAARAGS